MPSLSDLVTTTNAARVPSARVKLNGATWRGVLSLRYSQAFGQGISGGTVVGRAPPTVPAIGMSISWTWGYNGQEVAGFSGEVSDVLDSSYPDTWKLEVKDQLWRADKASQVIVTDPLNEIAAKDAIVYILTHYGGISSSRINIPNLEASGSAWGGSHWVLGVLTPVSWGDTDNQTGGTTALKAAQEICSCLGYWLYCDAAGTIRAKQMERKPSSSALRIFQRGLDLLLDGAPERQQSYDGIYNQVTVRGANTGVDGAQLVDQFQSSHPLLPSGVYRNFDFSSFLLEYLNEAEAGAASVTAVAKRIHTVVSRVPDVVRFRGKADPRIAVGATIGIKDTGVRLSGPKNYFVYQVERTLDLQKGQFDDRYTLDGGTGTTGNTTIPPPDAAFTWTLDAETLDGTAIVAVLLDGSGATSLTGGVIVSWEWETSTATYGGTPDTATGVTAVFIFEASSSPATIMLTVTDTTSKTGSVTQEVDLTGADTGIPPTVRTISLAAGSAWYVTPDGGATWNVETTNGDAIAVGTVGAGFDDRAAVGVVSTYGLVATRGSGGAGGLRQTLDGLASASTDLVSNAAAITSNIWINEANPARIVFAIGDTPYLSIDGGLTKTALTKPLPGTDVLWIMEDAAVENSMFCLAGADMYNATAPSVGWVVLYEGPVGATARQFVRSRDGQVTWICYLDAPSGEAAQRVENGAAADLPLTDIRTLALDKDATSLKARLFLVSNENPAALYAVDGLTGLDAFTSTQAFPADAIVQHMLADPDLNILYTADFDSIAPDQGAARKYFIDGDTLALWKALAAGEQGHMLGFGSHPPLPVAILLIPFGATGAADKIFRSAPGIGFQAITPPQASWYWQGIAANPFDNEEWLLWGNSVNGDFHVSGGEVYAADDTNRPLYHTTNGGTSWTAIALGTDDRTAAYGPLFGCWSDSDDGMWFAALDLDKPSNREQVSFWRGSGATTPIARTGVLNAEVTRCDIGGIVSGLDGELIVALRRDNFTIAELVYIARGGTSPVGSPQPLLSAAVRPDRFAGIAREVVMLVGVSSDDVANVLDYHAVVAYDTFAATANLGLSITAAADAVYVSGKTSSGIFEIHDVRGVTGTPVVTTVPITAGITAGYIRAGRAARLAVAARKPGSVDCFVRDGAGTWALMPGPAAAVAANLANYVEVLDA